MPGFESLLTLLCLLGVLQGLLLAAALGSLGGDYRRSNRLLGVLCLGAAVVLALILVSHRGGPGAGSAASRAELLEYALWPFAGPLLLLYVSLVTRRDRWPPRTFALHFLPGAVLLAYFLVTLGAGETPRLPRAEWMLLHQAAYTALTLHRFREHRHESAGWGSTASGCRASSSWSSFSTRPSSCAGRSVTSPPSGTWCRSPAPPASWWSP